MKTGKRTNLNDWQGVLIHESSDQGRASVIGRDLCLQVGDDVSQRARPRGAGMTGGLMVDEVRDPLFVKVAVADEHEALNLGAFLPELLR